ncbi:hypothetical protein NDU88_004307 [Pleurodeles waltl]|uniref:Uncharacterized protein n=1 Tax=Pleurodeles waltl TaxID=8319 RepID=A0AAV7M7I9_PLEWA|nr:hypothetical protein NDU88_004307 [Pleurodeles waltl]
MELDLASLPTLTVVQLRGLCIERGLPATTDLRKQILITSLTAWAEAQEVETEEAPEEEEKGEDANSNHSGEGRHPSLSEEEEERSSVDTVTRGRPKASGRKGVLSGGENPSIRERELEAQLAYIALEAEKLALEKKKWAYKEKRDGSSDKEAEVHRIREGLHGRRIKIQVYPGRRIFISKKRLSPKVKITTKETDFAYPDKGSRRSDPTGRFVPGKKNIKKETKSEGNFLTEASRDL